MADGRGLPHMCWFPRDFASSTRGWPLEARAIYRELLDAAWDMNGVPNDERVLRGIAGATDDQWAAGWPYVRTKFEVRTDGHLVNARMERDRAKALEAKAKQVGRARAGAEARWHRDAASNASSIPQASSKHASSIASSMPEAMLEQCPPTPTPTLISPSRSPPSETSPHGFTLEPVAVAPAKAKREATRPTRIPPDLTLTGRWTEIATKHMPEDCDVAVEFERFQSHFQANGVTRADWYATWRTWCLNAKVRMAYARKGATHGTEPTKRAYWQPGDPTGREDLA